MPAAGGALYGTASGAASAAATTGGSSGSGSGAGVSNSHTVSAVGCSRGYTTFLLGTFLLGTFLLGTFLLVLEVVAHRSLHILVPLNLFRYWFRYWF